MLELVAWFCCDVRSRFHGFLDGAIAGWIDASGRRTALCGEIRLHQCGAAIDLGLIATDTDHTAERKAVVGRFGVMPLTIFITVGFERQLCAAAVEERGTDIAAGGHFPAVAGG